MNKNKRTPLLQYWSTRYLFILFVGLILTGLISTFWIKYNTAQKRLESLNSLAAEVAESSVDLNGVLYLDVQLSRDIERRQRFLGLGPELILFVVDNQGRFIFSKPGLPPLELLQSITIPVQQEQGVQQLTNGQGTKYYIVKQVIKSDRNVLGSIFVVYPFREVNRNPEEIQLLILMLGGLAVLGLLTIYLLTRKLAKPIKDVADAATQIVQGNYDLDLDQNVKEQEIYELVQSFKDMTERLKQLEALRTELLAGVTHELKTPVTSISGLIQAVRDGVVTGEEAKEFLEICSSETARLQKMVEDLLDFNSFITGDIKVKKEFYNLNKLIREISYQWQLGQEDDSVVITTRLPDKDLELATDAMRLQQILYNLFNNAKQAFTQGGMINVLLIEQEGEIRIEIGDNGPGIPQEEQDLIFERFFRGNAKKDKVHGLGLGLSFSKMIAKALGGDLILKSSSPEGTTFALVLRN